MGPAALPGMIEHGGGTIVPVRPIPLRPGLIGGAPTAPLGGRPISWALNTVLETGHPRYYGMPADVDTHPRIALLPPRPAAASHVMLPKDVAAASLMFVRCRNARGRGIVITHPDARPAPACRSRAIWALRRGEVAFSKPRVWRAR